MFCFVDASGRNKFYQTLLPDYNEAGVYYNNEFKVFAATEAGSNMRDYGDQPYGQSTFSSDGVSRRLFVGVRVVQRG